jgi:anti-anti-sigma factor
MWEEPPTELESTTLDEVTLVRICLVRVGPSEAGRLREPLFHLATGFGTPKLVVDMGMVEYLSSAAIAVILGTSRRATERGGMLVLCNLSQTVQDTFAPLPFKQFRNPSPRLPFFAATVQEGAELCRG